MFHRPDGWLLCQGQAISRTTYAALFAICSTTYGAGDGSSTFEVPEFRGRTMNMVGTNISLGDSTSTEFSASSKLTTDSGAASPAVGTITVSTGAKDAGGVTVVNSVAGGGHTHTLTLPSTTVNFIIKT